MSSSDIRYPDWAPDEIRTAIAHLRAQEIDHSNLNAYREHAGYMAEMWTRLFTRPEMEKVWEWYLESDSRAYSPFFPVYSHQSLFFKASALADEFASKPKLSPKAYSAEMNTIAELANALAERLTQFPHIKDDLEWRANMRSHHLVAETHGMADAQPLDFIEVLGVLSEMAKDEGIRRIGNMYMPTKANAQSAGRSFFIRSIAFDFDYSPARIATFCAVALDDPDITPDLVRALIKEDRDWEPDPDSAQG